MAKKAALKVVIPSEPIKLDLGCGQNKKDGFIGVDRLPMKGVDIVTDLMKKWPWKDDTVAEIYMSHTLEHFTGVERVHIVNEMHRVLQKGATAQIIVPSWASNRAYGDYTHQWPPVADFWFYYLNKDWRAGNAPHNDIKWDPKGYSCDFDSTWGYSLHQEFVSKNVERQTFAIQFYRDSVLDIIATLTKK